jgi:hypothetical protein
MIITWHCQSILNEFNWMNGTLNCWGALSSWYIRVQKYYGTAGAWVGGREGGGGGRKLPEFCFAAVSLLYSQSFVSVRWTARKRPLPDSIYAVWLLLLYAVFSHKRLPPRPNEAVSYCFEDSVICLLWSCLPAVWHHFALEGPAPTRPPRSRNASFHRNCASDCCFAHLGNCATRPFRETLWRYMESVRSHLVIARPVLRDKLIPRPGVRVNT